MRIGFWYSGLKRKGDWYETFLPFARYVEELSKHFEEVVVFAPVFTRDIPYRGTDFPRERVRVVELPPFLKHSDAIPHLPTIIRVIREHLSDLDVVVATHVAPFANLFHLLGRGVPPVVFFVGSDPLESMRVSGRYKGVGGWAKRVLADAYFRQFHGTTRNCLYLVNGNTGVSRLQAIHPRIEAVRTSVLREAEFRKRGDTCVGPEIKLVSLSYLEKSKGIDVLVRSLRLLLDRQLSVSLTVFGDGPEREFLLRLAKQLGVAGSFHLPGVAAGMSEVSRAYWDADVFVFASRSEGNPRVIIEALAHSLPVVTTPCGSVEQHVRTGETGLIVPFDSPLALADAVALMARDGILRRRCIRNGFQEVENLTVENFIATVARKAQSEALAQAELRR